MALVRGKPRTYIEPENLERLKSLAADLDVTIFQATDIALSAGFDAIETNGINPKRIKRSKEVAA